MSAGRTPTTDEVRQMANSHDGVPPDVFDRWLTSHDRAVKAEALREAADEIRHRQHAESVRQMLHARADQMEKGTGT